MKKEYKYCWLNIATGQFSETWDEDTSKQFDPLPHWHDAPDRENWKLIKFQCLTDQKFVFTRQMKLR